jgi:DMSO/TMAO reductase YedYZ molybdopterin-dependent catalytic subunit
MKIRKILMGGVFGGATALVVDMLGFIGSQLFGLPRASYTIFDAMTRILPGNLITFTIDLIVKSISLLNLGPTSRVAKLAEQSIAVAQFIGLGIVFGVVLAIVYRKKPSQTSSAGMYAGLVLSVAIIVILMVLRFPPAGVVFSILWLGFVFALWGWVLGRLVALEPPRMLEPAAMPSSEKMPSSEAVPSGEQELLNQEALANEEALTRRQFLRVVGVGSFTILASAAGIQLLSQNGNASQSAGAGPLVSNLVGTTSGPAESPPQAELDARFQPVPGTRPELTSNADFYRIDINTTPPYIDGNTWRLELGGMVDQPLSLSLDDIRSRPSVSQAVTMECISNEVGGDLTSTSVWTGVPFKDILADAGLQPGATHINIEAVDGFYECVPMEEAMDGRTLLVYEMNHEPLPQSHGFPLRIYIPNHFGMKQPKWITRMEVIDHLVSGYWVDRGWSPTAIVKTTSVIDTVAVDAIDATTGMLPIGGIAWAGARGISKVEVKVDGGDWGDAELRTPALSSLTWVQWRYLWKYTEGRHTFSVRATDGTGQLQVVLEAPPHPDGATGIDSVTEVIPAV